MLARAVLAAAPRKFEYNAPGGERYSCFPAPRAGESGLDLQLSKPAISAASRMAARFADEIFAIAALCLVAFIGRSVATCRSVVTPLKRSRDAIRNYQAGSLERSLQAPENPPGLLKN